MSAEQVGWAAVMAKPMAEELAEKHIRKAGFRVYLPRYRKVLRTTYRDELGRVRRNGKSEIVMRPLIVGYLFVELHPGQQWRSIGRCIGVVDHEPFLILRAGGETPALIRPELIDVLRDRENKREFDDPHFRKKRAARKSFAAGALPLKPGERVRVESGPFAGYWGRLDDMDDSGRFQAIVEIFGRDTPIWLDPEQVTTIEVAA